jgi:hypothetical protein
MEPKTVCKITQLQIGDRFYKVGDSKKVMYSKVEVKEKRNKYFVLKHAGLQDGFKNPHYFLDNTTVVFMRHKPADND